MFGSKDLLFSSETYGVAKSLRFRSSASAYLSKSFSTSRTLNTKGTFSAWVKRGALGADSFIFGGYDGSSTGATALQFKTDNTLMFDFGGSAANSTITTQVFRDPSSWYHIVVSVDTTSATTTITGGSTDRVRLYVNGTQISAFSTTTVPTQSSTWMFALNTANNKIGTVWNNTGGFFDGYLAEVNFIDGQALTPTSFGFYDNNGIWQPKGYTGTYGTNGFYLKFTDVGATSGANTGYGKDFSGFNTNYWTTNNFGTTSTATTYDSMYDSPVNASNGITGIGNYCTWNPVYKNATVATTDGNLSSNSGASAAAHRMIFGTQGFTTASYFEVTTSGGTTTMVSIVGVGQATTGTADGVYVGSYSKSFGLGYATNAASWYVNGATNANGAATNLVDGTWGFAVDPANGKAWVRNTSGNWIGGGDPAAGTLPTFTWTSDGLPWFPVMSFYNVATTFVGILNAGQRSYSFTAPSGFSALNTQNLTTPTITNGAQYMAAVLYPGTGSSQTITTSSSNSGNNPNGTTFQPDFVWVKGRSGATDHALYDAVRGVQLQLESNTTGAETTETTGLTAFTSSGFTTGALAQMNTNTATYVAWEWNAGGSTVTNTTGSISSQVRANTSAGFSVVTYSYVSGTTATVGHGLGVVPSMIIVKNRTLGTENWAVYHTATGAGQWLLLSSTSAALSSTSLWNNTPPTSDVFSVGAASNVYVSGSNFVAYCFAPVAGYSAMGSFTANNSSDGNFIYTGFRPRYIMFKRYSAAGNWVIMDTTRNSYNAMNVFLYADLSDVEATATLLDSVSNGFKLRFATTGDFIWVAFAENPFKIARAR